MRREVWRMPTGYIVTVVSADPTQHVQLGHGPTIEHADAHLECTDTPSSAGARAAIERACRRSWFDDGLEDAECFNPDAIVRISQ